MTAIKEEISKIQDKIYLISNENKDLDDEIDMVTNSLREINDITELQHQKAQLTKDLEDIEKKVQDYLELTEKLEEEGMFDDNETDQILKKIEKQQLELIETLKQDVDNELQKLNSFT